MSSKYGWHGNVHVCFHGDDVDVYISFCNVWPVLFTVSVCYESKKQSEVLNVQVSGSVNVSSNTGVLLEPRCAV